jgi:hypothetical protein
MACRRRLPSTRMAPTSRRSRATTQRTAQELNSEPIEVGMIDLDASFFHHLVELVSVADRIRRIRAHAPEDDLLLKMTRPPWAFPNQTPQLASLRTGGRRPRQAILVSARELRRVASLAPRWCSSPSRSAPSSAASDPSAPCPPGPTDLRRRGRHRPDQRRRQSGRHGRRRGVRLRPRHHRQLQRHLDRRWHRADRRRSI